MFSRQSAQMFTPSTFFTSFVEKPSISHTYMIDKLCTGEAFLLHISYCNNILWQTLSLIFAFQYLLILLQLWMFYDADVLCALTLLG